MLELSGVNAFYGYSRALQDIGLQVGRGELLSVLGRNGVGKTTLLKTIIGLIDRMRGRIELQGTTSLHSRRSVVPASASPTSRRGARSSPTSPSARTF